MLIYILWVTYIAVVVAVGVGIFFLLKNLWLAIASGFLFGLLLFMLEKDRLTNDQKKKTSYKILLWGSWIAFILSYGFFLFLSMKK